MSSLSFNDTAFCKMVSHAVKYPHCSVNGLLLGKPGTGGNRNIEFTDVIPLFHLGVNLTPMAEIALMQIDEYAAKKGLSIIGYYISPENSKDSSFERIHNRLIDRISSNNSPCYVIIVGSTISNIQMGNVPLKASQFADGSYKPCDQPKISDGAINASMSLLKGDVYERVVDFDNHLDDISLDWTNAEFNKLSLI